MIKMITRHELNSEDVYTAIRNGEFDKNVISSNNTVVVVMTQDWCPQWKNMKNWIYGLQTKDDIDIYEIVYNKADYFQEFMNLKETKWNNHSIPYLRYYTNGNLSNETNYLNMEEFKNILNVELN
jgi:hypothetical protein